MVKHYFKLLCCGVLLASAGVSVAQIPNPIQQDSVLAYLDQLTQWQRDVAAIEPSAVNAREVVFRDSLRENATKVLQSGFVFVRSVASSVPVSGEDDPESQRVRLTKTAKDTQATIDALQAQRASASASARIGIDEQLRLENARLELLQTILANMNAASNKSPNKLLYTIDSLSRSIPELSSETPKTTKPVVVTEPASKRSATSIVSISATLFELMRKQRELSEAINKTTQLKKESMTLMKTLRSGLGEPSRNEADENAESDDKAEENAPVATLTIDERIAAYKQLSTNIVPLAESMRWMDTSKQTLNEWNAVLVHQREGLLSQLGLQVCMLLVMLAVPLALSEMVRRALSRVPDIKRRRQLNAIRRILTVFAIVIILLLNFISDFGSFATFAGFLTAGLALALQSVLVSIVAHFLFYGRYGVRNGDRVHVAGVTGDIIQIGMLRFYIRELRETENGLEPTGKTVAFSNSILFQGIAFYKYA